ncbi:hypothetical protein EV702DRAFT_1193527 [Suillus placidus]|uniref:Uncharacterized protein n=1 Tax=Suillus placidus TaxID=48579 RepID=A0A9P7A2R7_9AGAM|nr:hypothetical protein EV702DRAFT_1193527 [Suillus placidus]
MVPQVYSDGEEAPTRHPKHVPVPSAKVVSADNTAELELPSHRNAHNASCTASAALRPSGCLNLKQLRKGKKCVCTLEDDNKSLPPDKPDILNEATTGKKKCVRIPKDDNKSPPPDEPDILNEAGSSINAPHHTAQVHADDDVDAEGFLKDIEVMDIDEPEKPHQEHCSKDINDFFSAPYASDSEHGKKYCKCELCRKKMKKVVALVNKVTTMR